MSKVRSLCWLLPLLGAGKVEFSGSGRVHTGDEREAVSVQAPLSCKLLASSGQSERTTLAGHQQSAGYIVRSQLS